MDRNLNHQSRNETRYTSQNPPDSEEAARSKIQKLQDEIASIRQDLETQTVQAFPGELEFEAWKRSAATAARYKEKEIRFLEAWLRAQQGKADEQARRDLRKQISTLVENYQQMYSPVFGIQRPATDPGEAKTRITVVLALQSQIDLQLAQFREASSEHRVSPREQQEIVRPLQSIATEIDAELQYLRNVLHILAPGSFAYRDENREQSEQEIAVAERVNRLADEISSERPAPYNETENPPSTLEEAETRLVLVSGLVKTLDTRLEELSDDWRRETSEGLSKWAKRPISQLRSSLDAEINLLKRCIRKMQRQDQEGRRAAREPIVERGPSERGSRYDELARVSQRIREQAIELAKEIDDGHTPYTGENPPQNAQDAEGRLSELLETKRRLQAAFSDITEAWCSHPLRREDMPSAKKPLVKILGKVETEMAFLKAFLKERQPPATPSYLRWKSVCVSALTRASFEGFKLTPEEREVVTELLAEISRASLETR